MDMLIEHRRRQGRGVATVSDLSVDGVPECLTLEDEVREPLTGRPANRAALDAWVRSWKKDGKTAIPTGRFEVVIDFSSRFQKRMIHLLDVPGYVGVRAHAGEDVEQTEGCPLTARDVRRDPVKGLVTVGTVIARDALFAKIDEALTAGRRVWWDVSNPIN